jgi:cyclic pyranopterin phosphate synthase
MIDISQKEPTWREARAEGRIHVARDVLSKIIAGEIEKGDVLTVSQMAGIMAAKNTPQLVPSVIP